MKKTLLLLLGLVAILKVSAQPCTPNPQYADSPSGIWPLNLPPLDPLNASGYNVIVDIKTLTDTCVTSPLPMCLYISAMRISGITGLPDGFTVSPSYNGSIGGFQGWLNNGTDQNLTAVQGCFVISAPQSAVQAAGVSDLSGVTLQMDMYAKNQDGQSPLLASYTWTSEINLINNYTFGVGNPGNNNCTYSLKVNNIVTNNSYLPTSQGNYYLKIQGSDTCHWAINGPNPTWLSFSAASGSGGDSILVSYTENTGSARYAYFEIGGEPYSIIQEGLISSCLPGQQNPSPGIWPAQLPPAYSGQPYNITLDVSTITDTCVTNPLPLCLVIEGTRIYSVAGLPAGFNITTNYDGIVAGQDAWVNGGSDPNWTPTQGCFTIIAPQNAVDNAPPGTYPVTIELDLYAKNQDPQSPILSTYAWMSTLASTIYYSFDLVVGGTSPCSYDLTYMGMNTSYAGLPATAGTFDIDVNTGSGCNWSVIGDGSWFSYSPSSGTGNGIITFTYDANTSGAGRNEMLSIAGQNYLISQMMDTCTMTINGSIDSIAAFGGTVLLDLTLSDPDCYWNLITRDICEGFTVDPTYGTGSTSVTVTIAPNPDNTPRQCELNFGNGQTVTLNQYATTGTKESSAMQFGLYPNPAGDLVTLLLPDLKGKEILSVYTVEGQLLQQTLLKTQNQQISTAGLANGIYVFTLTDAKGNVSHKKVVISR